ncbi:hypothetical protein NDU88_002757, partial [Pleurodeles waltl]
VLNDDHCQWYTADSNPLVTETLTMALSTTPNTTNLLDGNTDDGSLINENDDNSDYVDTGQS